jgi:SWIM zinc finger
MEFQTFPPTKARDFETFFNQKTLSRAYEIVADEMIELLERSNTHLTAYVQGTEPRAYTVMIRADGTATCTCLSDIQPCKHVAAVLLYVIDHPNDDTLDLTAHLQALTPIEAKSCLLELANLSELRPMLLKRLVRSTNSNVPKGAIKALKKVLERSKNIEQESELGEAAFLELESLAPEQRSDEAWQLHELLEDYEIDYEYYDPEDESGDAYWEDRQSEWSAIALHHWATAESELGRGQAALETLLRKLDSNGDIWQGVVEIGKRQPELRTRIGEWLKNAGSYRKEEFTRDFLRYFRDPIEYENHLRKNLNTTHDYAELMRFYLEQDRENDALEIAAAGVRKGLKTSKDGEEATEIHTPYGIFWSHSYQTTNIPEMLDLLRNKQPSFEWERAQFSFFPNLEQYKHLATLPEFAAARANILNNNLMPELHFDILLFENDNAALEKLLNKYPRSEYALKVKHLFPVLTATIFKKAALAEFDRGSRDHYANGARWAKEYKSVEEEQVFKTWLGNLLEANKRRPALLDEVRKAKLETK